MKPVDWTWPVRPQNDTEFDEMMSSLDWHLGECGLVPTKRGLNALVLVSNRLGFSGNNLFPTQRGEPFSASDTFLRVNDWYREMYGDKQNTDFSPGRMAISLRGAYWSVEMPRYWGGLGAFSDRNLQNRGRTGAPKQMPSLNLLTAVDGLTQAMATTLSDVEVAYIESRFIHGLVAILYVDRLSGHDFFDVARVDYRHGVDAVVHGGEPFFAKWQLAHAAEKIGKGLLAKRGLGYPKGGREGHDIPLIAGELTKNVGVTFDPVVLDRLNCHPRTRYAEQITTQADVFAAANAFVDFVGCSRSRSCDRHASDCLTRAHVFFCHGDRD